MARAENFAAELGKSSRSMFQNAAKDSPSPGGEGRGKGGLASQIQFQIA